MEMKTGIFKNNVTRRTVIAMLTIDIGSLLVTGFYIFLPGGNSVIDYDKDAAKGKRRVYQVKWNIQDICNTLGNEHLTHEHGTLNKKINHNNHGKNIHGQDYNPF